MKRQKHLVVTGGAGFIGSHIASRLISEGNKVTVLDNLSTGKEINIPPGADFIKLDLGLESSYAKIANMTCDAVLHLAGQSSGEASFKDPLYDLRSHVVSTYLMLEWCRSKSIPRFLYASSMSTYGDPEYLPVDEVHQQRPKTFYAAAKISAEAYIKLYRTFGMNTTVFRLFSVYGPGQNLDNKMQGMISIFLSYMLEQSPVPVKGSKERFRDFVYIDDVVNAWVSSLENPVSYRKIYNVASGKRTSVEDLIESLKSSFGYEKYPVEYTKGTPGDQFGLVGDINLIMQDLKWVPKVDLLEGLKKMVEYEKRRLKVD